MNVTLNATEFPAQGTAVPKNQRQDLEEVLQSPVGGLLPIFPLPSWSSQTWLWAWLLRGISMAWRADQTCELGMGGWGMQSSKPSQPAAPNHHLLAAVKGQVSPHSRTFPTFLKTTIFIFLKGWTRLIIFLQETSGTWWRVCPLHGGLLSWQLSITRVCSLLSWRRFESIGHNYQVVGLGGGEEKKTNPYRWFQGEGMEEGTGIVRDKIIVWTSVNTSSSYYIDEGYHPQHLLFQMLFKSRMPQGAFCEHGDCVSVRCALTICLG